MADTEAQIDDLNSHHDSAFDHGEADDDIWREERRKLPTVIDQPFTDELIEELRFASSYHEGPFKISGGYDSVALFSDYLEFSHKMPNYPNTHEMGYTYVVPAEAVHDLKKPEARPEIRNFAWTNLTIADWEQLQEWRCKIDRGEPNPRLQRANEWFLSYGRHFLSEKACKSQLPTCRPKVHYSSTIGGTGHYPTAVRCINYSGDKLHFQKSIPSYTDMDVEHLQSLLDDDHEAETSDSRDDLCGTWDTFTSQKADCAHDHLYAIRQMEHQGCGVTFNYLVPDDLEAHPWVVLSSHGTHTHAPPPPNILPSQWAEFATAVLSKIDDSNITANKFLASKALKSALTKVGLRTLAAGHPALLQRNRIENLIRHWKIDTYPSGLDLAAVEVEYETDRQQIPDDCYIQDIFTYGDQDEHFLVVCMLKEQAELFQKMEFIEVDMSMKRLKGAVNKEIIFACQYFQHGKIITLARIFCNWEGTATYEHAFDRISVVLQNLTGQPLRWKYLNNPPDEGGIRAVVMDMSSKACSGLGKHLNKRDRLHRGWTENLSHVIRSCMVHFGRNIDQAIGRKNTSPHAKRMHELATARSPAEYESIITELRQRSPIVVIWNITSIGHGQQMNSKKSTRLALKGPKIGRAASKFKASKFKASKFKASKFKASKFKASKKSKAKYFPTEYYPTNACRPVIRSDEFISSCRPRSNRSANSRVAVLIPAVSTSWILISSIARSRE
ncbi:hypothetical protein E4U27_007003 [Claviceps purpurea]|nr:hypothetical protein E4U27_007003 [Claviceps purpurea]